MTLFVTVFYLVTPYLSHVFYLVTRRRIETGRVTALASDSGLGGWDHGGTMVGLAPPKSHLDFNPLISLFIRLLILWYFHLYLNILNTLILELHLLSVYCPCVTTMRHQNLHHSISQTASKDYIFGAIPSSAHSQNVLGARPVVVRDGNGKYDETWNEM